MAPITDLVETGLRASSYIFGQTKKRIRENDTTIDMDDLKAVKKAALDMNVAFTQFVKAAREREDRLLLELHLMRQASARDAIDRDANRARVFDLLRRYRVEEAPSQSHHAGGTNDLPPMPSQPIGASGISTGTNTVDKALGAVARIDASIAALSPTGATTLHGAGILAGLRGSRYTVRATPVVDPSMLPVSGTPPPPPPPQRAP
jgi:hypothetical protein